MIKGKVTIDKVKKDLFSLGSFFDEIGAIGITGSLARGDFGERSDIDVFIVVDDQRFSKELEEIWYERVYRALKEYWRDLTLFIYPIGSLRGVSSWAVLNLASESLIIFDKNLREL